MKLEQIQELWKQDSTVDREKLDEESLNTSTLHHKYYNIYTNEKLVLRKLETQYKQLRLEKFEFYTQGPSTETEAKGWKLPNIGRILKSDANTYVDADQDIIDLSLRIGLQEEKIEFLNSIIRIIFNRNYQIKNAIDFLRWQFGT